MRRQRTGLGIYYNTDNTLCQTLACSLFKCPNECVRYSLWWFGGIIAGCDVIELPAPATPLGVLCYRVCGIGSQGVSVLGRLEIPRSLVEEVVQLWWVHHWHGYKQAWGTTHERLGRYGSFRQCDNGLTCCRTLKGSEGLAYSRGAWGANSLWKAKPFGWLGTRVRANGSWY